MIHNPFLAADFWNSFTSYVEMVMIPNSRTCREHSIHIAPLQSSPGEENNGNKNRAVTEIKPSRFFPLVDSLSEPFPGESLLMLPLVNGCLF